MSGLIRIRSIARRGHKRGRGFGVKIVKHGHKHGLGRAGQFCGAMFQRAVMADDNVQKHAQRVGWQW